MRHMQENLYYSDLLVLSNICRIRTLAFAWLRVEKLCEFVGHTLPVIGIRRGIAFARDVRPGGRVLTLGIEPFLGDRLAVRHDRLGGTFRLPHPASDSLPGMGDQHVLALVKANDPPNPG